MNFGKQLEQLIEDNDISQKQLAKALNIAPTTLNGYLHNYREPDFSTLIRFADYFHVSTDYLLGLSEIKKPLLTNLSMDEQKVLSVYRSLPPDKQWLLYEYGLLLQRYDALGTFTDSKN